MSALRFKSSTHRQHQRGHRSYLGGLTTIASQDNQDLAIEASLHERARRSLYADCERAPFNWEQAVCANSKLWDTQ